MQNDGRWELVPYTRGFGVEISDGEERLFPHFQKLGVNFISRGAGDLNIIGTDSLNFVAVKREAAPTEKELAEWRRVLTHDGYLCQWKDGRWEYSRKDGSVLAARVRPEKSCLVVRYGAYGDALQASSILPGLKAQGYHVTFNCNERSEAVIRHDPNIDAWIVQDTNQVPAGALTAYWSWLATQYDKVVNLSETVEGTWLAIDTRPNYWWSHDVRHKYLNGNYLQFQHEVAGVPYQKPMIRFYSTRDEETEALALKYKLGGKPVILWTLAGSSIHKVWPHMDAVLARVFTTWKNARVVFCGDESCQLLEEPWRNEPRVVRKSGKWGIRQSLAFAEVADVVIGPETGVLSSVAMRDMAKIVLLSHSSHENLTRDWINTTAIHSVKTPCWPCHRLHVTPEDCPRGDATGTAKCQEDIPADAVWEALVRFQKLAEAA